MRSAHNAELTVFCKQGEDEDMVRHAMAWLLGLDLNKERLRIREDAAIGLTNSKIKILSIRLTKASHINRAVSSIKSMLTGSQLDSIIMTADSRLDQGHKFYLRFDKEDIIKSRNLSLTDSGNCFHLKITIAAYPKDRKNSLRTVRDLFSP